MRPDKLAFGCVVGNYSLAALAQTADLKVAESVFAIQIRSCPIADFGPNSAHYDRLSDERDRLKELVDEGQRPVSAAGTVAIARVALTWVERDSAGAAVCDHFGEEMMLRLAEAVSAGFAWPPRPGS